MDKGAGPACVAPLPEKLQQFFWRLEPCSGSGFAWLASHQHGKAILHRAKRWLISDVIAEIGGRNFRPDFLQNSSNCVTLVLVRNAQFKASVKFKDRQRGALRDGEPAEQNSAPYLNCGILVQG